MTTRTLTRRAILHTLVRAPAVVLAVPTAIQEGEELETIVGCFVRDSIEWTIDSSFSEVIQAARY